MLIPRKKHFIIDKSKRQKKGINFRRTQENTFLVHKSSVVLFGEKFCRCFLLVRRSRLTASFSIVLKHIRRCKAKLVVWKPKCRNRMNSERGWAVGCPLLFCKDKKNKVIFGVHISGALKKKRFFEMKRDIWLKRKWCFYLYGKRNENKSSAKKMSEICHVK